MSLSNTATEITLCNILCDIMGHVPKNIIVKISGGGFEVGILAWNIIIKFDFF